MGNATSGGNRAPSYYIFQSLAIAPENVRNVENCHSKKKKDFSGLNIAIVRITLTICRHLLQLDETIWVFPKIEVPQNGWFIKENLI